MDAATLALIAQLGAKFVPIIMGFVAQRKAATGQLPTNDEVIAHLASHVQSTVAEADRWLGAHPQQ
jgi:ribosomal protein L10